MSSCGLSRASGQRDRVLLGHPDDGHAAGRAQPAHRLGQHAGRGRALDEDVEAVVRRRVPALGREAHRPRQLQAEVRDVGDGDRPGAERPRRGGRHEADRPGAGDEDVVARGERGALAGPDADRQRLEERALLVAHPLRDDEEVARVDAQKLQERAVVGRRGEELQVGAQVVAPGEALLAVPARRAWLDRDAVARPDVRDLGADGLHLAGDLVPEDDRAVDDVVADPPELEVGGVRPAHPHRLDAHDGLAGTRCGLRALLDRDLPERGHDGGAVRHGSCPPGRPAAGGGTPVVRLNRCKRPGRTVRWPPGSCQAIGSAARRRPSARRPA